jgi:hypothetical protein
MVIYMERVKFPSIPHLPWSPHASNREDLILSSDVHFLGMDVVVTEKLDGENTTLYSDYFHARSVNKPHHASQNWVKALHGSIAHFIPNGMRICGENIYAKHSIFYDRLSTYFYVFGIFYQGEYLSWKGVTEWAGLLGLSMVPVLYEGLWTERKKIEDLYTGISSFGLEQEGYVVRNKNGFKEADFAMNIAKFVRPNHVQTDEHWKSQAIIPNQLSNL